MGGKRGYAGSFGGRKWVGEWAEKSEEHVGGVGGGKRVEQWGEGGEQVLE